MSCALQDPYCCCLIAVQPKHLHCRGTIPADCTPHSSACTLPCTPVLPKKTVFTASDLLHFLAAYSVPATVSSPVIDAAPVSPIADDTPPSDPVEVAPASPIVDILSSANPFASATTLAAAAKAAAVSRTQAVSTMATDNSTSTDDSATALYAVLRVIGTSVTPFNYARQSTLLNALGQVRLPVLDMSISSMCMCVCVCEGMGDWGPGGRKKGFWMKLVCNHAC